MKRRDAEEGTRRKKRKWVLPVSIIAGFFLLCLVVTGVFLLRHCSGIYVRTSGGRHMVVFEAIGPVVLSTEDKPDRFDGIETGDRVIAVCGFLHETYPAQSEAKFVFRLWKGIWRIFPRMTEMQYGSWGGCLKIRRLSQKRIPRCIGWDLKLSRKCRRYVNVDRARGFRVI